MICALHLSPEEYRHLLGLLSSYAQAMASLERQTIQDTKASAVYHRQGALTQRILEEFSRQIQDPVNPTNPIHEQTTQPPAPD